MRFGLPAFDGLTITRRGIVYDSGVRRGALTLAEVRDAVRQLNVNLRHEQIPLGRVYEGARVELEHTPDSLVAVKIALDHLRERLDYYERLKAVERKA